MLKYIPVIAMILCPILLACILPLAQYLKHKLEPSKTVRRYFFSKELFDFNLDEDVVPKNANNIARTALADRGWVRKPMGCVMEQEIFESKKMQEYQIDLP